MKINKDALATMGVEMVIVFGSRARGSGRPDSDLDVGVLFLPGTPLDHRSLDQVRPALGGDDHLDLVCLNRAGTLLLKEVALDGVPQFEIEPGTFERFRLRAFKRYMDTEKFRRFQADSLRAEYG